MPATSLTIKGQVTIPAQLRHALDLSPGDKIDFKRVGKTLVLKRHENDVTACFGLLKARRGASLAEIEKATEEGALE